MGRRFYVLISILSLLLHPVFPGIALGETDTIVSLTTGRDIHVLHFDIDLDKKWILERSTSFQAFGTVGVTTMTTPDNSGKFNLDYTFQNSMDHAQLGHARFDFDTFEMLSHKAVNREFGNFSLYTHALSNNPLKFRIGFNLDENLFTSKIKPSGKAANAKSKIIGDDPNFGPVAWTFAWDGHVAAQVSFNQASGVIIDFQSLNGKGKATGAKQRFGLGGDVFQVSASIDFDGHYFIASREFKLKGTKETTSINIANLQTGTNIPLGGFEKFQGFKTTKFLPFMPFNSLYVFQDFLLYTKDKSNKLTLNVGLYDIQTGQHLGKDQILLGPNSQILQNNDAIYGVSVVGGEYSARRSKVRK